MGAPLASRKAGTLGLGRWRFMARRFFASRVVSVALYGLIMVVIIRTAMNPTIEPRTLFERCIAFAKNPEHIQDNGKPV